MKMTIPLTIMYSQIIVFLPNVKDPGLLWSEDNVAQGFAWGDGTVSFGVPGHIGMCLLEIDTNRDSEFEPSPEALYAIEVPFDAVEGQVEIGTVILTRRYPIDLGSYKLIFEVLPSVVDKETKYAYKLHVMFMKCSIAKFCILKKGELQSGSVLNEEAERA